MKKTIALALALALAGGCVHADENKKADAKKAEKAKSNAKKKDSDKNAFQKAESDIGHWARKNKVWGTPRPGD